MKTNDCYHCILLGAKEYNNIDFVEMTKFSLDKIDYLNIICVTKSIKKIYLNAFCFL
jgi:hypothetical protein